DNRRRASHRDRPGRAGVADAGGGVRVRRCPFRLSQTPEPHVEIAVDLLDTAAKPLNGIQRTLDPSGQLAHPGFQPIHAQFGVDCRAWRTSRNLTWAAAAVLTLQQREIALQTVEAILRGPIL